MLYDLDSLMLYDLPILCLILKCWYLYVTFKTMYVGCDIVLINKTKS